MKRIFFCFVGFVNIKSLNYFRKCRFVIDYNSLFLCLFLIHIQVANDVCVSRKNINVNHFASYSPFINIFPFSEHVYLLALLLVYFSFQVLRLFACLTSYKTNNKYSNYFLHWRLLYGSVTNLGGKKWRKHSKSLSTLIRLLFFKQSILQPIQSASRC